MPKESEPKVQDNPESTPESTESPAALNFMLSGERIEKPPEPADLTDEELMLQNRSFGGVAALASKGSLPEPKEEEEEEEPEEPKEGEEEEEEPTEEEPEKKEKEEEKAMPPLPPIKVSKDDFKPKTEAKPPEKKEEVTDPLALSEADTEILANLPDDARDAVTDTLDFLREAATVNKDHERHYQNHLKFYRQDAQRRAELVESGEDPDEDPAYLAWREKSKPRIAHATQRKIDIEVMEHRAERRAAEKLEQETAELKAWKRRKELEEKVMPQLQEDLAAYNNGFVDQVKANEATKEIMETYHEAGGGEKGVAAMHESFGEEVTNTFISTYQRGMSDLHTINALRSGLEQLDPDQKDQRQQSALITILALEKEYAGKKTEDGKTFVSWAKWKEMSPDEQDGHFTLTGKHLREAIQTTQLTRLEKEIKAQQEAEEARIQAYLKRRGIKIPDKGNEKKVASPAKEDDNEPKKTPSPRIPASRSPGVATQEDSGSTSNFWMPTTG
jgi:hypothetical protein